MELRQIRYFQTVVEENSFSEAAEVCHISQPLHGRGRDT